MSFIGVLGKVARDKPWYTGSFPFRILTFLEDACARHLVRRVGGSYQFIHRLLLDYFADLELAGSAATGTAEPTNATGEVEG